MARVAKPASNAKAKALTAARIEADLLALLREDAAAQERSIAFVLNRILRQHYASKGRTDPPKAVAAAD